MRYQVPQFIEIEDKIFGPLTLKQFIYLAGGAGLCLIFFSLLPLWLTIICSIPVMALCAGLAFYQINGRPLIVALEHATGYLFGHKLYLWKQREAKASIAAAPATAGAALPPVPKLSESKLKDLAWSLNIKDRNIMGVNTQQRTGFEI
ncbi:MAG TPA: PrgI family protein [Candidatus Paceibacterota bacterium]|nr:PrgI family protein [Candidatus Paceibacterota bacterium]